MNTLTLTAALNAYTGDNIWQDIILGLDAYDEAETDAIDAGQSDRFATGDGTEYRCVEGVWVAR